jgi:hypothetical protein
MRPLLKKFFLLNSDLNRYKNRQIVAVPHVSNCFKLNHPIFLVLSPFFGVKKAFNSGAIQSFFALKKNKITSPNLDAYFKKATKEFLKKS